MAKRYIDDSIIYDANLQDLSPEAFKLWVLMLAKSDDFGFLPANPRELALICGIRENPIVSENIRENLGKPCAELLQEIVDHNLGFLIEFCGKIFFHFKPEKFQLHQAGLIHKRKKSKYLGVCSEKVQEILGDSRRFSVVNINSNKKEKSISKEKSKIKRDTLAVENLGGSTSDSSIPQILNSSSPDIPSQVITVIHRIGQELELPAYAAVTDKAWRPKLVRWGQKIGYQCLLRQAEALENWLAGRPDKKKLSANQRTNPTAQFFNTWLPRVFEKDYTSGDSIMPVEKSNGYHSEVEELGSQKIISHDQHV